MEIFMLSTIILDTFSAIEQRRSIKQFDPNYIMPEEDIKKLMALSLLSPTSFNIQNWRFVVITDKSLKEKICKASWNQSQVTDCSLLVVLCADLNAHEKQPERYWKDAPKPVQDALVPMIIKFYKDNLQLQRDEAMRSTGIAGQTIMLAAKAMGYDSCPMVGFDPKKITEIIKLPPDHLISMMITIGKSLQPARVRAGQLPYEEVVLKNTF